MASIDELRDKFGGLTLTQKKQFIESLRTQLQNSTNAANKQFLNECIRMYNDELRGASQIPGKGVQAAPAARSGNTASAAPATESSEASPYENTTRQKSSLKAALLVFVIVAALITVSVVVISVMENRESSSTSLSTGSQTINTADNDRSADYSTELAYVLGLTAEEAIGIIGQPGDITPLDLSVGSVIDLRYKDFEGNYSTIVTVRDDRVWMVNVVPKSIFTIYGVGAGADSYAASQHLINLGFTHLGTDTSLGDINLTDGVAISFGAIDNDNTVLITLIAADDYVQIVTSSIMDE